MRITLLNISLIRVFGLQKAGEVGGGEVHFTQLVLSLVTIGLFAFITEEKKQSRNVNTVFPFLTQLVKFLKLSRCPMVF